MNKQASLCIFLMCLGALKGLAQGTGDDSTLLHTGCEKPNILTTHPLGLFIMRISHNFSAEVPKQITIQFQTDAGNVWEPPVKAFLPRDPATRQYLQGVVWHKRDSAYALMPQNHDSMQFAADAVIRTQRAMVKIPVGKKQELDIELRGFFVTGGSDVAPLTTDAFIEKFHSTVAGGDNPFARKQYGFNKAEIYYQDSKGRNMHLRKGQFVFPGIQIDHYLYPAPENWLKRGISVNVGLHAGLVTSVHRRAFDLGISASAQKNIRTGRKSVLTLATAGSVLQQQVAGNKQNPQMSSNTCLFAIESHAQWRKKINAHSSWLVGLNHYFMSPYNRKSDFDNLVLQGNRYSTHWHIPFSHLYRSTENWTLILGLVKKYTLMCYVKEDFRVDNAPDIQTGISLSVPLCVRKLKNNIPDRAL